MKIDMARPKKKRYFDGVELKDYLYPDNKGREGYWRYLRPDGTFKTFFAESVDAANSIAEHNNQRRESFGSSKAKPKNFGTLAHYAPEYIAWREEQSPDLKTKESWRNRVYAINQFCREITTAVSILKRESISLWWDQLSNHQQRHRHAEFRRFFNWLMGRQLLPKIDYNPFTLSDDKPRLYTKSKPKRKSLRLTRESFWKIYAAAGELGYECLQIAMGISLLTFMREGDICTLRLDEHIEDDLLKRVIGKSANQRGSVNAARLKWDLGNYTLLKKLINRSRELSMKHGRCPYVISHRPLQKRLGNTKTHIFQVLPRRLIEMFDEARKLAGFTGENPPVFHGIRSLADAIAKDAGYDIKTIQHGNAHTDEKTTMIYLEGHQLPYEMVEVQLTEKDIGGSF